MNKEYLSSIHLYSFLGAGMSGDVYKCDYKDYFYAYKVFKDVDYKSLITNKLDCLCEFYGDANCVFPYKLIYKRSDSMFFDGYIMDFLYNYDELCINNLVNVNKKELLIKARTIIEKLHNEYKFIHGDIRPANFMYNQYLKDLQLIDFDNSISIDRKCNVDLTFYDEFAYDYMEKIGIEKELDMFLFNLLTYSIINNIPFDNSLENIESNNFKNISSEKARNILKSYKALNKKTLKKEYIIDYL